MKTNIRSIRMERGAIKNIAQELGRFSVFTMEIPWKVTKDLLGKDPEKVQMVTSVNQEVLDSQIEEMPPCDTIVGIGGGQAVDAAKYMSWKKGIRLVSIPTILSVDAFVTTAAGVRRNHSVVYVGESFPDPLIIDFDVIRTAPANLNIAGIGDLLSVHTATFDWELAESRGKSEYPFSKDDVSLARGVVANLESLLSEIRNNEDAGLKAIVEGYMKLNEVCMPAGHWRIEEGSEHYLFYELEERLKRSFIHGDIIGLGIYIMSRLQKNDPQRITTMMDYAGLDYQPKALHISRQDLEASLLNLKIFVTHNEHLWYTIINEAEIDKKWVDEVLNDLSF
jgi:glycerol-1-phosphate dehydrogenase [NAD(P)+]